MPPSKNCTDRVRRLILWRMVAAKLRSDGGSASLEFITAGMILLLPMVYLILTMSQIQGGSFAVEGAARGASGDADRHSCRAEVHQQPPRARHQPSTAPSACTCRSARFHSTGKPVMNTVRNYTRISQHTHNVRNCSQIYIQ